MSYSSSDSEALSFRGGVDLAQESNPSLSRRIHVLEEGVTKDYKYSSIIRQVLGEIHRHGVLFPFVSSSSARSHPQVGACRCIFTFTTHRWATFPLPPPPRRSGHSVAPSSPPSPYLSNVRERGAGSQSPLTPQPPMSVDDTSTDHIENCIKNREVAVARG